MSTTFTAIHRHAPISARKARPVADMVRGKGVNEALEILHYVPRRASTLLMKVIRSAMANAAQEGGAEPSELVVSMTRVNDGPLKQKRLRWRPGPMGRAMPIHKRTCHIHVVLEVTGNKTRRPSGKSAPKAEEDSGGPAESDQARPAGQATGGTEDKE